MLPEYSRVSLFMFYFKCQQLNIETYVVAWSSGSRRTSNLRIASRTGSNPVKDKPLFPSTRNFTLIAQYWLVPGMDLRVFL